MPHSRAGRYSILLPDFGQPGDVFGPYLAFRPDAPEDPAARDRHNGQQNADDDDTELQYHE